MMKLIISFILVPFRRSNNSKVNLPQEEENWHFLLWEHQII
jgi:hypothetical protein